MRFFKFVLSFGLVILLLVPVDLLAADDDNLINLTFRYIEEKQEYYPYALTKGIDLSKSFVNSNEGLKVFEGFYDKIKVIADNSNSGMDSVVAAAVAIRVLGYIQSIFKENSLQCELLPGRQSKSNLELMNTLLGKVKVYIDGHSKYINKAISKTDISSKLEMLMLEAAGFSEKDFQNYLKKLMDVCKEQSVKPDADSPSPTTNPTTTYGSGNVTCGNRTFNCNRGGWFSGVSDQCYCCGACTPDDLLKVGNTVLKWLFSIIGAVGLAIFVWGGFTFITSAGSSGKVDAGKKTITNAVIGLVIMFSAGTVVIWIQKSLGIESDIKITNKGPAYVAPSTDSGSSKKTEANGTIKIGESCLYNQSTNVNSCAEGLYCYSINQTKGVCLPKNQEKSVSPGGVCYILPGDSGKDMCKLGTCQAADKTPGTKGTCPTVEDNQNMTIGDTCKSNSDCAGKSLFTVSATCYKKSGSKTGKCIPMTGRDIPYGGSCYVLPGSGTNDCANGLLCVQNPDASDPKLKRTVGELGVCYNYKNQTRGYICTKNFECAKNDSCVSVPKASNRSYCLKTGTTFTGVEGQACESFSVYSDGTSIEVDTCSSGLTCMEVDGSMKCSH